MYAGMSVIRSMISKYAKFFLWQCGDEGGKKSEGMLLLCIHSQSVLTSLVGAGVQ